MVTRKAKRTNAQIVRIAHKRHRGNISSRAVSDFISFPGPVFKNRFSHMPSFIFDKQMDFYGNIFFRIC
jgi:hypothetical protein